MNKNQATLPRVTLGTTGLQVSRLGLGGFHQVEISSEIVEQVVSAFLDVGGNYIETARGYGDGASEEKIGRVLDQYGIPFFYRQATIIYDQGENEIWKPTFTLYPYGGLVIDYVPGKEQSQKDELLRKEQVYRYNQIPAVLLGPKDITQPKWEDLLYEKIEQMYRRPVETMKYLVTNNNE